jgi:threonylcarbamoyladenosine tRNA methylthiotransferase MtaB
MPHLHLSLQSGDDLILKRMKRRHSRADAIAFCERVRRRRPGIAFGGDLIAGFPTESETAFANTLDLVDACDLSFLHVFRYSPRPGTPAARMPQLPAAVGKARAARLRAAGAAALARHLARRAGSAANVLLEDDRSGRDEDYAPVRLDRAGRPGSVAAAVVTAAHADRLDATLQAA